MTNFPTANNKQATPTKLMTKTNELGDDVGLHTLSRVVRVQMAWMTIERIANLKLQIKGVFLFLSFIIADVDNFDANLAVTVEHL